MRNNIFVAKTIIHRNASNMTEPNKQKQNWRLFRSPLHALQAISTRHHKPLRPTACLNVPQVVHISGAVS